MASSVMEIPATTPEQISYIKTLSIAYRTMHSDAIICDSFTERNIRVPFSSYCNKYRDFLSHIVSEIPLTQKEQDMYMYKPKTLSLDLYGITELWSELLILNNAFSIKDFKPVILRAYDPSLLKTYITEILILENEELEEGW